MGDHNMRKASKFEVEDKKRNGGRKINGRSRLRKKV